MSYLVFNGLLLIYLLWDGYNRQVSHLWAWALGTLLAGVLVLPFYFPHRPLKQGEVRTGGYGWNVLKNFSLLWTLLMAFAAVSGLANVDSQFQQAQTDAEEVGTALGTSLGLGMIGCTWFLPMVGALTLGLFLKKDVHEEGPTGPLAEN
jgi:O-antigen/teichoic acid export membrane protein